MAGRYEGLRPTTVIYGGRDLFLQIWRLSKLTSLLIFIGLEFWEHHFQCKFFNTTNPRYQNFTKICTGEEKLTSENTRFEAQLQFVSDAVMAFAYALRFVFHMSIRAHISLENPNGLCFS